MLKESLLRVGAVRYGSFKLRSGEVSDTYVDIKGAITNPETLEEVSSLLAKNVSAPKIAGVELGAALLLPAVSAKLNLPFVVIRKEQRAHGIEDRFVGKVNAGESIDLIEDVVTTGGSVLEGAALLRKEGAIVTKVICVVDRERGGAELLKENGMQLISLVTLSGLKR